MHTTHARQAHIQTPRMVLVSGACLALFVVKAAVAHAAVFGLLSIDAASIVEVIIVVIGIARGERILDVGSCWSHI